MLEKPGIEFYNTLKEMYSEFLPPESVEKLNLYIYDSIKEIISPNDLESTKQFINNNPFIKDLIKKQFPDNLLFRQPIILFLYYLVATKQRTLLKYWPLPEKYLQPLFSDLGFSMPY